MKREFETDNELLEQTDAELKSEYERLKKELMGAKHPFEITTLSEAVDAIYIISNYLEVLAQTLYWINKSPNKVVRNIDSSTEQIEAKMHL